MATPAVVGADVTGGGSAVAPVRADFWSVMGPLTGAKELPAPATTESSEAAADDAVEQAITRVRSSIRQPVNPRRSRKRK